MRVPRVRFTVRRMMVAVAVVGLLLGGAAWMRRRSLWHLGLAISHTEESVAWQIDPPRAIHLARLAERHARAARYPWLPLAPGPPGPK
jgi:hypothetical protein